MKTNLAQLPTQSIHHGTVFKKALISNDRHNGQVATFNYAWLEKGMQLETHAHADCEEYYLFLSGRGRMFVGSEWYDVGTDDYVVVPVNQLHTVENTGDDRLVFITLRAILQNP